MLCTRGLTNDADCNFFVIAFQFGRQLIFETGKKNRRDYYNNDYLKSDAWQRKRYGGFKRANWPCVHCGAPATQVHHKRYAKVNIGREPIEWLESVCKDCHESIHGK